MTATTETPWTPPNATENVSPLEYEELTAGGPPREKAVAVPDSYGLLAQSPIEPEEVVKRALRAAKALAKIYQSKPRKVVIGGKQYLEIGDWVMLGQFFGVTARTVWSRPVKIGVLGIQAGRTWEARVEILRNNFSIGAAEAMCSSEEQKWHDRDEFQIRSMAITRATSKALSMVLRGIPTLAGFEETPSEEIVGTALEQKLDEGNPKDIPPLAPSFSVPGTDKKCPQCGQPLLVSKFPLTGKNEGKTKLYCPAKCGYRGKVV